MTKLKEQEEILYYVGYGISCCGNVENFGRSFQSIASFPQQCKYFKIMFLGGNKSETAIF